MSEDAIKKLDICLGYLKEQQRLLSLIENEPQREIELLEILETAKIDEPDAVEAIIQSSLKDIPKQKQNNRDALIKLYHSDEHQLVQELLPVDLINEEAINELISILLMEEATTIEEAIKICRAEKLP